jgi:hypothetical protein
VAARIVVDGKDEALPLPHPDDSAADEVGLGGVQPPADAGIAGGASGCRTA